MVLGRKVGICTICKKKGKTDWHHIISQHHARRTGQEKLISDPNNVIELCRKCHNQTTASMVRKRLEKQGKTVSKRKAKVAKKDSRVRRKSTDKVGLITQKMNEDLLKEKKVNSIESLTLRGVFEEKPPTHRRLNNYLIEYLKIISFEDPVADKWSVYFQENRSHPGALVKLYPEDHWLHNPSFFDKEKSLEWEEDGFCWIEKNGFAWRKGLTMERSQYEIKLSQIYSQERAALEKVQRFAIKSENTRRLKEELEKSIKSLTVRGVYFEKSPVDNYSGLINYLKNVSVFDEMALYWVEKFNEIAESGGTPLLQIYPEDHWLHSPEDFEEKLSSKFEKDGFCWTQNGGAWKNNLSLEQSKAEINLAQIRSNARLLIQNEENRMIRENERLKKIELELNCIKSLTNRGVFIENSPVNDITQLPNYLRKTNSEYEVSKKWSNYLEEYKNDIFPMIYPEDHWLHESEKYNQNLSSEFEKDGFSWTKNGGVWKNGLSMEQAKAEIRLADIKTQQQLLLEREQEKLDRMKKEI